MGHRFPPGDERGTLNLVDEDAVRRGLASARTGTVIPLAQPIAPGASPIAGMRPPPQHFMSRDGGDYAAGLPERPGFGFADDSILLACHGATHLDALAHVWQDGVMYGGFSSTEVTSRGARRCGIEKAGPFVCRGLLVDAAPPGTPTPAPGTPIGLDVLRAALRDEQPRPGVTRCCCAPAGRPPGGPTRRSGPPPGPVWTPTAWAGSWTAVLPCSARTPSGSKCVRPPTRPVVRPCTLR